MSERASSRTWLALGGALLVIGVLVVIALVREPIQLDPNTPEGTVQNYLQAISDHDYEGAFNLIDPETTEGCAPSDLARAAPSQSFSATLGEAETTGETAYVTVSMSFASSPGPFEPGMGSFDEYFELKQIEGQWYLTGNSWPYYEWMCDEL